MDGRKRTVQIKFRVTEAERDLILEKMKLVPTRNMAAYSSLEYCVSGAAVSLRYLFKSIYSVFSFLLIFTGILGIRSLGGSTLRRR